MSPATAPQLADVLRSVRHVLLDFDGPLCSIFANLPAKDVAHQLYMGLREDGLPEEWRSETDPLALLRRVDDDRPSLVIAADRALARLEEAAARSATATLGGESLLKACLSSERSVWIVSNNSSGAIRTYLEVHGLQNYVAGIFGRISGKPSAMKPDPRLLTDAMSAATASPTECIFIGDAVRDVQAGHAVGVSTIGYANKPGKDISLRQAGAIAVVDSMQIIADALDSFP